MKTEVILRKMKTLIGNPIAYSLDLNNSETISINQLINKELHIHFSGEIYCIKCGRKTSKSFSQGFCYPCFISAPETEECVLKPELCQAHLGIARDIEYAKENCLSEQFVYLASSDVIKVGVTRHSQIPTRWIDQGASFAMKIASAPNRHIAGLIEVALKKVFPDKTNWRAMLMNKIDENPNFDLAFDKVVETLGNEYSAYIINNDSVTKLMYPVTAYPQKLLSNDLDKTPDLRKTLTGIKGQYLIFNDGSVLNIRKYGGYKITLEF